MLAEPDSLLNLTSLLGYQRDDLSAEGLLSPDPERLAPLDLNLVGPLEWRARVQRVGGSDDAYLLEGKLSGTAKMPCRRCLDEVDVPLTTTLLYSMDYAPSSRPTEGGLSLRDDNGEDVLVIERPQIDISELLLEVFALELPLTVLCRPDCKGLSSEGINLNDHPEAASVASPISDEESPDNASPFAVLKDLDL
ncbi:MAG: DUF177 domain-containing protein [Deinococcota bacterium]